MAYLAFLRRLFAAFIGLTLLGVCFLETKPLVSKDLSAQVTSSNCGSKATEGDEQGQVSPDLQPWYHLTPQAQVTPSSQDESSKESDDLKVYSLPLGNSLIVGSAWYWELISYSRAAMAVWGSLVAGALPTRAP